MARFGRASYTKERLYDRFSDGESPFSRYSQGAPIFLVLQRLLRHVVDILIVVVYDRIMKNKHKLVPQLLHFKYCPNTEAEVRDLLLHLWRFVFPNYTYVEGYSDRSPDVAAEDSDGNRIEVEIKTRSSLTKKVEHFPIVVVWEHDSTKPKPENFVVLKDFIRTIKFPPDYLANSEEVEIQFANELLKTVDRDEVVKALFQLKGNTPIEFIASDLVLQTVKAKAVGKILNSIIQIENRYKKEFLVQTGKIFNRENRRGTLWLFYPEKMPSYVLELINKPKW